MSPKRTNTALARWIVTKRFLEQVYKPGITVEEIEALEKVSTKTLKDEINKLAKDPIFKAVVKANPDKAFSMWEKTDASMKKDIFKTCDKKIAQILDGRTICQNIHCLRILKNRKWVVLQEFFQQWVQMLIS